jgi:hypothetical protein
MLASSAIVYETLVSVATHDERWRANRYERNVDTIV